MKLKYLSIISEWLDGRQKVKPRSLFELGGR